MPVSAFVHRLKTGVFVGTLIHILTRKAYICSKRIRGLKLCGFAGKMTLLTLLIFLMIGGVELNPGPSGFDDQLENVAYRIQNSISGLEQKMMSRLNTIEDNQRSITENIKSLTHENRELKNDVQFLMDKCDYLENQSRRNNLIFDGISRSYDRHESWEECERIICEIIYQGIGIHSDINIEIERAHRLNSRSIIVKFKSFKQKSLILSKAKNLRHSYRFSRVFVNEDFSERVKQKRTELFHVQRDLRQQGIRSNLRFDKLFSGDAVYTVDNELRVHQGRRWGRFQDRFNDGTRNNGVGQDFAYPDGSQHQGPTGGHDYGHYGAAYGGSGTASYSGMGDTGNRQGHHDDDSHQDPDTSTHSNVSGVEVRSPQGHTQQATSNQQTDNLATSGVEHSTPAQCSSPSDTERGSLQLSGTARRPGSSGRGRGDRVLSNQNTTPLRGFGRGTPGDQGHVSDRSTLRGQFDNAEENSRTLANQTGSQKTTEKDSGIRSGTQGGKTFNNIDKGANLGDTNRVLRSQAVTRQSSILDFNNIPTSNK